jgi:hypothetical protein
MFNQYFGMGTIEADFFKKYYRILSTKARAWQAFRLPSCKPWSNLPFRILDGFLRANEVAENERVRADSLNASILLESLARGNLAKFDNYLNDIDYM